MNYMTTKNYRPVNLMNDMDRMFNQFLETSKAPSSSGFSVDIAETEDVYRIIANIPGFSAEDVDVKVDDNLLVIEAREMENTEKQDNVEEKLSWHVRERKAGTLKRSFVLPEDVQRDAVEAKVKNGVLSVVLLKTPAAKPFNVKVQGK